MLVIKNLIFNRIVLIGGHNIKIIQLIYIGEDNVSENSKSKVGFLTAFQVAAVWFGAHVGGGFATGNQTMNFFVKYGWHSIWLPAVIIIIIGLTYRESLVLAKNYGTYDYKSWSKKNV